MESHVMPETVLSLEHITKLYPSVRALDDVSVSFQKGEVHALVGENGAGKSTLIKVITGYIRPEQGTITIKGKTFEHGITPQQSRESGVEAIYQEFNQVDALTAAENICMGKKFGRFVNQKAMNEEAQKIFDRFHIDIDPTVKVGSLSSGKKQIVEIAKAISKNSEILIMDEPTASLSNSEIDVLMSIVNELRASGVTILYISHRLDEIFRIADRVSVFRDGCYIATRNVAQTTRSELIRLMVGREMSEAYPTREMPPGEVVFAVENLTGNGVKNISFQLHRGEVLGFAGLVGSGRSEIMKVIYGAKKKQWGHIYLHGKEVQIGNPRNAIDLGIGLVPEDRKKEGCLLMYSVETNLCFNCVRQLSNGPILNRKNNRKTASRYQKALGIKTPNLEQHVLNLSGGNQQKVVVGKVLAANAEILIFDEPTRGIDVGAKHEIYELINQLCAQGKSVIMVTSDMEELLGMSDRIVVFHEREMAGILESDEFDQERILAMASGYGTQNLDLGVKQ